MQNILDVFAGDVRLEFTNPIRLLISCATPAASLPHRCQFLGLQQTTTCFLKLDIGLPQCLVFGLQSLIRASSRSFLNA